MPHKVMHPKAHYNGNEKKGGEKESTARVLLAYSQLDKSKRETIEKHVTRYKSQFYASNTRYDPIREWISLAPRRYGLLSFV